MSTLYRVEAHDGNRWSFGVITAGSSVPKFCSLAQADTGTRAEMEALKEEAARLCGGTLRVARVPLDEREV
jgi:hypothetical protein